MANLHQPRIIETTIARSGGTQEPSTEHTTERVFRIEETDTLWVGLNGISLERGNTAATGTFCVWTPTAARCWPMR